MPVVEQGRLETHMLWFPLQLPAVSRIRLLLVCSRAMPLPIGHAPSMGLLKLTLFNGPTDRLLL